MFVYKDSAIARIRGTDAYSDLVGTVVFQAVPKGVMVSAEIYGLPAQTACGGVFAFHIHEGDACSGTADDPFASALGHYNPKKCPHPYHAGDLPPLFSNDGYAYMQVLTNRFTLEEIIGRVLIIHSGVDDFSTQPSGNAGSKIACGKIERM